ncbi:tyrosine-type recombinase/integrase [Shimia thalassica]|uniref:tyrosine-type recombinase/integrase n=1 Tax=Shimia thalassica TaxID=1715693 RepID=UPI0027322E55|nr:site-specific integrase [Shimia thalassica]MDP2520149.1 site-specific integrase [Shimia thalassica]
MGLAHSSAYNVDWSVNKLKVWVGSARLKDFSGQTLVRIKSSANTEGLAPVTARKIMRLFKAAITDAMADNLVPPNTFAALKTKKGKIKTPEVKPRPQLRSIGETMLLSDKLRKTHPDLADMLVLAAYTGMRFGEISGLQWESVSFKMNKITVERTSVKGPNGYEVRMRTKTKSGHRKIPMAKEVREMFIRRGRQFSGLIFKTKAGKPIPAPTAANPIKKAATELGVAHGWHCSRHYWCSLLIERGRPMPKISKLMGHSSMRVTQEEYAWAIPDPDDDEMFLSVLNDSSLLGSAYNSV